MKKLYLLLTFFVLFCMSSMGQVIFSESFEDNNLFYQNWWLYDADGDSWAWQTLSVYPGPAPDGDYAAASWSINPSEGTAKNPDNWMISQPISLGDSSVLSFWVASDQDHPGDHFAVYICANWDFDYTNPPANFEDLVPQTVTTGNFIHLTVGIPSEYANEEVRIAFRHYNSNSDALYYLMIDNITITAVQAEGPSASEQSVTACEMYVVESSTTMLHEDFEGALPSDWNLVDADGDGDNWAVMAGGYAHTGLGYIASASWDGTTYYPQNWLITPAISVPDTGVTTFSWWAGAQDPSWYSEHYEVLISTASNAVEDFNSEALYSETLSSADWVQHSLNLNNYAGQTVYIAFVHKDCSGQYRLNVDDIEVTHTNTIVYTESGDYTLTFTNQYGYDSVVTLHLTIVDVPTVGTYPVQNITSFSAEIGGYLETMCGNEQPELGVCYSTSPNPTMNDTYVMAPMSSGSTVPATSFMLDIDGLNPNTTYYVRAFGVTSEGAIYGQEETFTTYGLINANVTVTNNIEPYMPIDSALVRIYYGERVGEYYQIGDMIAEGETDSEGHFYYNNIVMTADPQILFVRAFADGYDYRTYIYTTVTAGTLNSTVRMPLTPCYEVPYWVFYEQQQSGDYRLSWWSAGYDPDEPVDPEYPNLLTYNVYENGTLIAEGLTNQWYMLPSFNANSCYQVRSICTNGALSDTSFCATIKPVPPTVVTYNPTEITGFSAVLNGEITSDGNAEIYSRGFYTNTIPTLDSGNVSFHYLDDMSYVLSTEVTGLEPETTYYVWAYAFNQAGGSYGNMLSFTTTRACYVPVNLQANDVMASSALITWTNNNDNEGTPAFYELSYKVTDADSWTVVSNITTNSYLLSGLQQQTSYTVRVRAYCDANAHSSYTTTTFNTGCLSGASSVTIGEGTGSSSGGVLPTNIYYKHSYTQQIYQSNEIGAARTISNIELQYFYSTAYSRNLDIYLLHTNKTAFASTNDWVSVTGVQPVFSGYVNFTNAADGGWVNIPLTTPFEYNGSENLVLVVNDKTGSYFNNGEKFYTHYTSQYSSMYAYKDGSSAYSPSSPGTASGRSYYRNNIKLPGACITEGCDRSNVAVVSVSDNSAQLAIAAGNDVQAVELEYKAAGANEYTPITVQGNSFTLTGLTSNTDYELRIRSLCTEDTTDWKTVNFSTLVAFFDRLYVKTDGTGNGGSWEQATNNLAEALTMAALIKSGYGITPEIWVAEGTYYNNDLGSSNAFTLNSGTKLYGGFAGTETSIEERDIQAHPTILDGQNNHRVLYQNYDYYTVNDLVVVDGFTIRNGNSGDAGAGAYLNSNFEVRNCRFLNNTAMSSGGAVYVNGTSGNDKYDFIDCEFIGNSTDYQGGAVCDFNDHACYLNCKISGNHANNQGGGIYGGHKMVNCEISNNTAGSCPGVYELADSLVNCDVVGNVSTSTYSNYGGLMYFYGVMINTVVWGNTSNGQPCNIVNCNGMFAYNSAVGGLENYEGVINLSADNYGTDANHPFFVSPENGDYRLRNGSALIDVGTTYNNLPDYDMAGESRVYGDAVEIGCYEFHNEEYCLEPLHLEVSSVLSSSALLSWRDAGNLDNLLYYELSYKLADAAEWTVQTVTPQSTYKMLTGLLSDTTYVVRMRSFCTSDAVSAYTPELVFNTVGSVPCPFEGGESVVFRGESNLTNYAAYIPSYFYYNYSYSQQIYQASEIGGEGMITSLSLQYFYDYSRTRTMNIYLGHTSKSSFSNSTDWVPIGDLQLVYSGSITFNNGGTDNWFTINLQNNFEYNGEDNLVLVIDDNTGGSTNSYNKFYTHQAPVDYATMYAYSSSDLNPNNSFSASSRISYRNNLKLNGHCVGGNCDRSNLVVMNVTPNSAKLVYAPGASATAFELQYGVDGSNNYETLQAQDGEYNLTGLRYNTTYEARIRSLCGEDSSSWKRVKFTTPLIDLDRLYVTTDGTGDASSWTNASNDLAWALNTAARIKEVFGTSAEVWVAEGTYYGMNGESAFTMVDGVNVYGGFAGTETELSQRDINNHPTVLDGQNSRRVLYQPVSFDDQTVWDGFTIQNGNVSNFSGNSYNNYGGGAFIRNKGVLRNCRIINNAAYCGGGVYGSASSSYNSGAALEACTISHNTSSNSGAGVYAYYTRLSRCEVSYNTSSSNGAGVYVQYASVDRDVISNCLIANNTSNSSSGAGIYMSSKTKIQSSTIVNNKNKNTYSGAGVYAYYDAPIENCIVWGNRNNNGEANLANSYECKHSAVEGAYSGDNMISLISEPNPNLPYYPNFVNPSQTVGSEDVTANVDWHLADGSVCVNRGDNELVEAADSLDLDGNVRIQVGTVDLGCYESPYNGITLPEYNGIVYVKENGTGSGTSWDDAMSSLSSAVQIANMYNADVWVAAGTYYGDSVSSHAFIIMEGVNVYGGFVGNEAANYDLSLRDYTTNQTILDGQNNQRLLFQNNDFSTHTVWDGFTVRNGNAKSNNNDGCGGGAYLKKGVTLRNCVITENVASSYGGGVYTSYSDYYNNDTIFLINCRLSHNTSSYQAGGAYLSRKVTMLNCVIDHNVSHGYGGGVYLAEDQNILSNCLVANNTAYEGHGAGVYTGSSTNIIRNSTIVNNKIASNNPSNEVNMSSYKGAGIYVNYGTVTNCIVWGNKNYSEINGIEGYSYTVTYVASDYACMGDNNVSLSTDNENDGMLSPHFVNPSNEAGAADVTDNADWHLQQGSPCVNRGDNSGAEAYDLDGNARVQMDTIDLGCYESPYNGIVMPSYNGIVYVKENGAGNMTGDSWANAMSSIQTALNVALMNHADVWVAAGTYHGDGTSVNAFVMKEGVDVYGGFAGNEESDYDLSLRDFENNTSILDGQYAQRVLKQEEFSSETYTTWDGFTIQNGRVEGHGAGAYIVSYGILSNCVIKNNAIASNNSTSYYGAGVYAHATSSYGKATIRNCTIEYNLFENSQTYRYGGGLFTRYTDVYRTEISHNSAMNGGGVYCEYYSSFTNCLIYGNTSIRSGGGVYVSSTSNKFVNCDVVNNMAGNTYSGGGIYFSSTSYNRLTNDIIWGNKSGYSVSNMNNTPNTFTYCAVEEGPSSDNGNIILASANDGTDVNQYYVRFIDPQNGNFQLHPSSNCLDNGSNDALAATDTLDFYGNQRIFGTSVDIGCSEAQEEGNCHSPVNLTASNITTSSAQLAWEPRGSETQWAVVYGEVNGSQNTITVDQPNCSLTGLVFNRSYTARVRAICAEEAMSIFSIPVNFQTDCNPAELQPLGAFANMFPADESIVDNNGVTFSWDNVTNATSYDLYLWKSTSSMPSVPTYSGLTQPVATNCSLPGYSKGAVFYWKVVAWNECISDTSDVMTLRINADPDLHVSAVNAGAAKVGQSLTVSWTVTNDGEGRTPNGATWTDYIWLAQDADVRWYDEHDRLLATVESMQQLQAGESYTNQTTVTIPNDIDPGSYYLFVFADQPDAYSINFGPTGGVAPNPYTPSVTGNPYPYLSGSVHFEGVVSETKEHDNFFYMVLNILPPPSPDLVVSSVTHGGNAISGNAINVTWTVENAGEAAAMGSWVDAVYLSTDTVLDMNNDYLLGRYSYTDGLAINGSYQRTESVTIPIDHYGDFYVIVTTDITNTVYEGLQEFNNKGVSQPLEVTLTWLTDLVVTEVTLPSNVVDAKGRYECSYTVTNDGASPTYTSQWYDAIYIGENPVFDMNNVTLLRTIHHSGVLDAGESYTNNVNIVIPANASGQMYLFVVTDKDNSVFEYNAEDNNTYNYLPALEVLNPDLQVSSIVVPDMVDPNNLLSIQWSVRNNGPGRVVDGAFKDNIYINGDRVYSAAVNSLNIAVGDSIVRTAVVRIPCVYENTAELTVSTDVEFRVLEASETNNEKTLNLVIATPDLIVSDVTSVADQDPNNVSLWSGTTAELSYNVANIGEMPAAFSNVKDRIYLSTSANSYQASDLIYTNTHDLNLDNGVDNEIITCTVTIPNGISGTYYYHVVVNADTAMCEGNNLNNNVSLGVPVEIQLSPSPNLVVTSVVAPTPVYLGAPFVVTYTIQNTGDAAVNNIRVAEKFYYSMSPTSYDVHSLLATTYDNLNLAVNGTVSNSATVTLPVNIVSGYYYIHVVTDAENQIYEHNGEDNNTGHSNGIQANTYQLDLALTQIDGPTEVQWGQTVTYTLHVHNNSSLPTLASSWKDVVYMSPDEVLSSTDQLMREVMHSTVLEANSDYTVDMNVTIPYGAPATAYLIAITDYNSNNVDININNNVVVKMLNISSVPTPDLAVSEVEVLGDFVAGQPTRVAYKVTNVGELNIVNQTWNDKVFISYNNSYESADELVLTQNRQNMSLAVNEFYRDTLTVTVPVLYHGDLYLLMMANANNNPYETVRDNNMMAVSVNVILPLPGDLVVKNVACQNTIVSGNVLHAVWTIQNIGDNHIAGNGLRSLVYISTDTTFDANDRLLGSVTSNNISLAIDATMQQNLDARVSGLSAGEYYLIVKTDVTNAFNEVNDNNNTGHLADPFTVTIRPLPFNEDVYDTLINDEVSDYVLNVGDNRSQTVRIHVNSEDSLLGAVNMIYATHNAMGDNLNYSYSTIGQYTANSELYIPSTMAGYYGVNFYGSTPTNNPQNVVVRADILPFELREVNDNHGGNTGVVTVELTGSRFRPDMTICLRNGNEVICADTLIYVNYYQVFAQFDLTGRTPGVYDMSAVNFCEGEAVLTNAFTIEDGQPSSLSFNLLFPSAPRPNRNVVMLLEFGNTGNVDLHDQVLEITSIGGAPIALTPEGINQNQTVLRVPLSIDGEPAGLLRPGSYGTINIYGFSSGALIFTIKPVVE